MKSRLQLLVVLLFIGTAGIIFILSGKNTENTDNAAGLEVVEDVGKDSGYNSGTNVSASEPASSEKDNNRFENKTDGVSKDEKKIEEKVDIFVHVCGAVNKEGVYQVKEGSRVVDAIKAAGGLAKKAASYGINQAELLKDGMQVYIPTKNEASKTQVKTVQSLGSTKGKSVTSQGNAININTATKEELMKLNGVGEAKAALIITYRETNGGFKNTTDLMKIKGIKQKFFDKIKDSICV